VGHLRFATPLLQTNWKPYIFAAINFVRLQTCQIVTHRILCCERSLC